MAMSKEEFLKKTNQENFLKNGPKFAADYMCELLKALTADMEESDFKLSSEIGEIVTMMMIILRTKGILPISQEIEDGRLQQTEALQDMVYLACYCYHTYYQDEK